MTTVKHVDNSIGNRYIPNIKPEPVEKCAVLLKAVAPTMSLLNEASSAYNNEICLMYFRGVVWIYWCIANASLSTNYTYVALTYWDRVTHICVVNQPSLFGIMACQKGRRQAIVWSSAVILLIGPLETIFREILFEVFKFSFKKMIRKCRLQTGGHFVSASKS